MGMVRKPLPAKLFIGMLAADESFLRKCETALAGRFGPIDLYGPLVPWDHSNYYSEELGPALLRKFVFFRDVIDPETLPGIKVLTNSLELESSITSRDGTRRTINIDPGYLTEAKVILVSTKDYAHRIYLGQGIYGEVELRYRKDLQTYVPLEHAYPDFRSESTIGYFKQARTDLQKVIHEEAAARHQQRKGYSGIP